MAASSIEDITIDYTENNQLLVKQLDKEVLTKGAWSTIMFKYQEWDKKNEDYGPIRYSIRRYQKKGGEYQQRSKFNISSKDQAEKVIGILSQWIQES